MFGAGAGSDSKYSVRMTGGSQEADGPAPSELLSALEIIESQPLAERADAFTAIHDDLARRLDQTLGAGDPAHR